MKAISIMQPWATLIVMGAKRIETRSWNTQYRGPILIHASQKLSKETIELCKQEPFSRYIKDWRDLPRGMIIGHATIRETYSTEHLLGCFQFNPAAYLPFEQQFGDYSAGRYGWYLDNVTQFEEPIPAKGKLSIWEYEGELI